MSNKKFLAIVAVVIMVLLASVYAAFSSVERKKPSKLIVDKAMEDAITKAYHDYLTAAQATPRRR